MSLLKSIEIGGLRIQNNVFLAPLAGISDSAYRCLGRRFGAGLTFTGMVSSHGLVLKNRNSLKLLRVTVEEKPAGVQLFGSDALIMSRAVSICNEYPFDLLDINGGCSVRKVLKSGAGAGILEDPERFYKIVKASVEASHRPVSVKLRLGLAKDRVNILENAAAAQEAGASLITLHPRNAADGYSGRALWEYIALVKQSVGVPVCGNGGIRTPADAVRMVRETGCDAVMVGRGAVGNPWLIRGIIEAFRAYPDEVGPPVPSMDEKLRCALEHLDMMVAFKGEGQAVKDAKRHLHRYLKGIPDAARLKNCLLRAESAEEARVRLERLMHGIDA